MQPSISVAKASVFASWSPRSLFAIVLDVYDFTTMWDCYSMLDFFLFWAMRHWIDNLVVSPVCYRHLFFFTFILSLKHYYANAKVTLIYFSFAKIGGPVPGKYWSLDPDFCTKFQQPSAFIFRQAIKAKAKINVVFRNFPWNSLPHVTNTPASILHVKITERFGANKFNKIN